MHPQWDPAVRALARRVVGHELADRLDLHEVPGSDRRARHEVANGRLRIAASDPISASVALRDRLRQGGIGVHWPTSLPLRLAGWGESGANEITARVRDQYMLNFCTSGYTTAHWGWEEWEREIDWMAMHGITMPLVLAGHEAVLAEVYRRHGLDDDTVLAFLGEPIYLPWQFMGCRDGYERILARADLARRAELGARIVTRMRELGMMPVLPGFTGHVPRDFAPGASRPRTWQDNTTWFLGHSDPRFSELAADIVRVQREIFGRVTHIASDPFIETPPAGEGDELPQQVARALLRGFRSVEPRAVWVLQAWPFAYQPEFWTTERVERFLGSIPDDALLILDLWAEQAPVWPSLDGYPGREWHWCGLLNFGGRSDAVADLPRAVAEFEAAHRSSRPPSGLGLSMESMHHNGVFFELLADLAWSEQPNLDRWIRGFARERYASEDPRLAEGWSGLRATVYDARGTRIFPEDFHGVLVRPPLLEWADDPAGLRRDVESQRWFDPAEFARAWGLLLDALATAPALAAGPLGLDLVEVAQAACSRVADELVLRIAESTDPASRRAEARRLSAALADFDAIFATRAETRLAHWEQAAAENASTAAGSAASVRAARRLVTSWNERPGTALEDYSARLWSGLVDGYYRPRLAAWIAAVELADVDRSRAEEHLEQARRELQARFVEAGARRDERRPDELLALSRRGETIYRELFVPDTGERMSPR